MTADFNEEIIKRLDLLIKLNALGSVGGKEFKEQVRLLDSLGMKPIEIAQVLSKTSNNVRVTLSYLKRKTGNARKIATLDISRSEGKVVKNG